MTNQNKPKDSTRCRCQHAVSFPGPEHAVFIRLLSQIGVLLVYFFYKVTSQDLKVNKPRAVAPPTAGWLNVGVAEQRVGYRRAHPHFPRLLCLTFVNIDLGEERISGAQQLRASTRSCPPPRFRSYHSETHTHTHTHRGAFSLRRRL